ncbi:MAG TPA: hypothetical protein DCM38_12500 [Gammaproteobacteria bacterium]|nr:hypothetical protein [Gammaproteobacteria bacterium]
MDRIQIGRNSVKQARWKILLGVPLIYLPILICLPFVIIGVVLIRLHLKLVGGMEIKSYWDFVPSWISHRYTSENQIIRTKKLAWLHLSGYKFFWIFNCKLYCPLSVALFDYTTYLVKIVENWWCPFYHEKKSDYVIGAIDQSYWHLIPLEKAKLHPEDRDNPIWNDEIEAEKSTTND